MRRSLRQAVRRGVRVRLILAGKSDVEIAKQAERYMYRWLFRSGIEIHEYGRNVLHGKIAVRDGRWVTGGSYNVNNVSAYASIEMNLDVDDVTFGTTVRDTLQEIIDRDCIRVTESDYRTRYGVFHRLLQFASYEIFRLVFFLFTFYFRQR
jgi:cardiolipin synthase